MYRSRHQIRKEKKITNGYCKLYSIFEIIEVLRNYNDHRLWDKKKPMWNLEDWKEFFKLILNSNETNSSS